jgi:hypothetical protein
MPSSLNAIRHWISIGLFLLGILIPLLFLLYQVLFYRITSYRYLDTILLNLFQWLPVTSILLLIAAYVWSDKRWHNLAWIIFGLSFLLSIVSFIVWLRLRLG